MGRKIRCHVTVDDPRSLLADVKQCFINAGYELEREENNSVLIFIAGSAAWTAVGTHQWSKTSRTVIVSNDAADESTPGNVEFLYDVSWLSIHYRPQGKVLTELEDFFDVMGYGAIEITYEYETQI